MKRAKQGLSILLALLLVALTIPVSIAAEPTVIASGSCGAEGDNVIWTLTDDQVLTLSGTGAMAELNLEEDINEEAFYKHLIFYQVSQKVIAWKILSVLKEEGMEFESYEALMNACENDDELWDTVTWLGTALMYDESLIRETMPKQIIVEEGITNIAHFAFYNLTSSFNLQTVTLPTTLVSIGRCAFAGNYNLRDVAIPNNVKKIYPGAFGNVPFCNLDIPESCDYIGGLDVEDIYETITGGTILCAPALHDVYIYNDNMEIENNAIQFYEILLSEPIAPDNLEKVLKYSIAGMIQYYLFEGSQQEEMTQEEYIYYRMLELYQSPLAEGLFSYYSGTTSVEKLKEETLTLLNDVFETSYASIDDFSSVAFYHSLQDPSSAPEWFKWYIENGETIINNMRLYSFGEAPDEGYVPLPWITVHANPGSVAHQMALTSGLKFECLNHNYTVEETSSIFCKEDGIRTFTCPDCGKAYTEIIPKGTHTTTLQNKVDAACTTDGYTGDEVCTVCGETITKGKTIPALGHTDENNDGHCDRCGEQMTGGDHCKFCGKIHNGGFFDKLTGFFHKIFAIFKR